MRKKIKINSLDFQKTSVLGNADLLFFSEKIVCNFFPFIVTQHGAKQNYKNPMSQF